MEERIGRDFSAVRIHTDAEGQRSASALQARAYTVGSHVVFGNGEYAPDTRAGQMLLAHELVHVAQQGGVAARVQRATADGAASTPVDAADAEIEALDLAPTAKAAAKSLKKAHPALVFTSGRRTVASQASAMAANIVSSGNRNWIADTYASAAALQQWVDGHPNATTQAALAAGLEATMNALSEAELGKVSKHLSGAAFDVQPQESDVEAIKADIKALAGLSKFLESEGGLTRWHAQFKRAPLDAPESDPYEREADTIARSVADAKQHPMTFPIRHARMNASYVIADQVDGQIRVRMPVNSYLNGLDLPGMHDMPPAGVIAGMTLRPDQPITLRHYEPSLIPFKDDAVTEHQATAEALVAVSKAGDLSVLFQVAQTAIEASPAGALAGRALAAGGARLLTLGARAARPAALAIGMGLEPMLPNIGSSAVVMAEQVLSKIPARAVVADATLAGAAAQLPAAAAKVAVSSASEVVQVGAERSAAAVADGAFARARQIVAQKFASVGQAASVAPQSRAALRASVSAAAQDGVLSFLLKDGKLVNTAQRGMTQAVRLDDPTLFEAGHVASEKIGGDVVVVMSAWKNRFLAATIEHPSRGGAIIQIPFALEIGGHLVDLELAADWYAAGLISERVLVDAALIAL